MSIQGHPFGEGNIQSFSYVDDYPSAPVNDNSWTKGYLEAREHHARSRTKEEQEAFEKEDKNQPDIDPAFNFPPSSQTRVHPEQLLEAHDLLE